MKKKLKLRPNSIYKEEIHQMIDDIIPIVDDFYKKRGLTVKAIVYDYTTDLVSFDIEEPKGYYPKFSFYIASSDKGVRHPTGRPFVSTIAMKGVSQEYQFELREKYGVFPQIAVGDCPADITTKEKLKYIFDKSAERLAVWDSHMIAAEIFLF